MNIKKNNDFKSITTKIISLKKNRNIVIFLIFFFISTLLWFLNTLNKEYTTDVNVPVRFLNIPNRENLSADYANNIEVRVSGHGYNIFRIRLESFTIPVQVNLNRHILSPTTYDQNILFFLTENLKPEFNRRFGKDVSVVAVNPDTLFFKYTPTDVKKVPVKPNVEFKLQTGFMLADDIKISPDSVYIRGERAIIDSIHFIETKKLELGTVNKSKYKNIKLKNPGKLKISENFVRISLNIFKFVDDVINVSIHPVNFPDNNSVKFIPNSVKLHYRVPIDKYKNVDSDSFSITADYEKRENNIIYPEANSRNKQIKILRTQPSQVYFLIQN